MQILLKYFSHFSKQQVQQYSDLLELYANWNQKINVISRKDIEHFYVHHVLHSLSIAFQFDFCIGDEVLDLGTGGGFPGIPLAIFFPQVHFHLIDSINKKLTVVNDIVSKINLNNVTTQQIRAEDLNRKFDIIVTRAVAPLRDIHTWSKPLLKKVTATSPIKTNGLICLKGGDLTAEISNGMINPKVWEISKMFNEDYFLEKFILFVQA